MYSQPPLRRQTQAHDTTSHNINGAIDQKCVKRNCKTGQFPELAFCGQHNTLYGGVHGSMNHYNMNFDPKLGHVTHEIRHIPYACAKCSYTLDKPWNPGVTPQQQKFYQPVKDFTYCPVLGYMNNWNTIHFSHKATSSEGLEKINQLVLEGISDNKDVLVQTGQYGAISTTYKTTMVSYVIEFLSESYTLQENTLCNGNISAADELVVK